MISFSHCYTQSDPMFPLCTHVLSPDILLCCCYTTTWTMTSSDSLTQFIAKISILIPTFFHLKFLSFLKIPHTILLIIHYLLLLDWMKLIGVAKRIFTQYFQRFLGYEIRLTLSQKISQDEIKIVILAFAFEMCFAIKRLFLEDGNLGVDGDS